MSEAGGCPPGRLPTRPARGRLRLLAAAAIALVALAAAWQPSAAAAAPAVPVGAGAVQLQVVQVSPSTPAATTEPAPLNITLRLANTTDGVLRHVEVTAVRGDPINSQRALDAAIAKPGPVPGDPLLADLPARHPVRTSLAPEETKTITFPTTTSTVDGTAGLCLCQNQTYPGQIYPLFFQATYTPEDGSPVLLDTAQTFVPSFGAGAPKPVRVSWVWPLLERPHRTTSDTVFTDDELASSVSGGRLDRLLSTLDLVLQSDPGISMTLLADPALIDELAVMAAGNYRVSTAGGKTTPGTGSAAAAAWLQRLRSDLAVDPRLQLAFTPYADPDVRSLASAGLGWAQQPDAAAQARITAAIGGHAADTHLSWPAGGSLNAETLGALVHSGVRTVIVDDRSVPGGAERSPVPDALARESTPAGKATLAVTSAPVERYVGRAVAVGGSDDSGAGSALPLLTAEVAIRAVQAGDRSHFVVITPPRTVDPDPVSASQAILDTADAGWSQSLSLAAAAGRVHARRGRLRPHPQPTPLPGRTVAAARYFAGAMPVLTSLLTEPAALRKNDDSDTAKQHRAEAGTLLNSLSVGLQRSESAEWGADDTGARLAVALRKHAARLIDGVDLIPPTRGKYTLGSSDSKLPVTIENSLNRLPVFVQLGAHAAGGLPGFHAADVGVQKVLPNSRTTVHLPVEFVRVGRIKVRIALTTPDDQSLGTSLQLSVRSTALGEIGKIITFAAAGVLAAALLVRLLLQLRRRRRKRARAAKRVPVGARS